MKTILTSPLSLILTLLLGITPLAESAERKIDFTRDIRPILSNACFHCHGPDEDARQADLRLDQRDSLFADTDGRQIVVPGNPDASELVRRILSHDPDEVMPPSDSNKKVTKQQRQQLVEWFGRGFMGTTLGRLSVPSDRSCLRPSTRRGAAIRLTASFCQPSNRRACSLQLRRQLTRYCGECI